MIVNYDRKTFILQATEFLDSLSVTKLYNVDTWKRGHETSTTTSSSFSSGLLTAGEISKKIQIQISLVKGPRIAKTL